MVRGAAGQVAAVAHARAGLPLEGPQTRWECRPLVQPARPCAARPACATGGLVARLRSQRTCTCHTTASTFSTSLPSSASLAVAGLEGSDAQR
eukprot:scaffold28748_cov64-Phaeocystis_antarctica.AAC.13